MGSTSSILPSTDSLANSNNIEDNSLYENKFILNDTKVYDTNKNKELNIDEIKKNIENDPCLEIYIRYKQPLAYEYWKNQLKK